VVVLIMLAIILLVLYLNTGSAMKTGIILLAIPFSATGAILLIWWLDYNMSIAVWVGLIALPGVDAETRASMLLYLDLACERAKAEAACGASSICATRCSKGPSSGSGPRS
jgi:Cu(I)/Ag(I) efflux system membrane protein CusA/SilA